MDDSNEVILSYQRMSADCELYSCDYILDIVQQLKRDTKDSHILDVICCAVPSFKRSKELHNHKLKLISEKNKQLKDKDCLLRKKYSASKETKLKYQISKIELQGKVSRLIGNNPNLRHEVSKTAGKNKKRLKSSSDEDEKYIKLNKSLKYELEEGWKKNKKNRKRLSSMKKFYKMTQKNSNEKENRKFTCAEDLNDNQSETDETTTVKQKIDLATGQLNQALFNSEELENKSQSLHQNILAMTDIQEKCKIPENREEKLKQELSILETHRSTNMIDCREAEMLKQETEETCRLQREEKKEEISVILQTSSEAHEQSEQRKSNVFALKILDVECRNKDMESSLLRAQTQEDSPRLMLGIYQQLYHEQLTVTAAQKEQINIATEKKVKLQEDIATIIAESEILTHSHTGAVLIPEETRISGLHHHGTVTPHLRTSSRQHRVRAFSMRNQRRLTRF